MRLNVASIKASRIPGTLGLCNTDPRLLAWLNEAQPMLLDTGRWWGAIKRAQFCVSSSCFILPREIDSLEQLAICGQPIGIVSNWYAFTQNLARVSECGSCSSSSSCCSSGCGGSPCSCGHLYAEDHGTSVSFNTTKGANKVIRFYPSNAVDVGKKIVVQGYDSNNIWVRTTYDGAVRDGEQITLAMPFVDTTTVWYPGSPTGIIKEATSYLVRMYSYDTATTLLVLLAEYQPDETLPSYRTFFIPGFDSMRCGGCTADAGGSTRRTITAIVKLAHVPLVNDTDWLLFENLNAYKAAMMAMKAREDGDEGKFLLYMYGTQAAPSNNRGALRVVNRGGAIPLLAAELRSKTGDRTDVYVHREATNSLPYMLAGFR